MTKALRIQPEPVRRVECQALPPVNPERFTVNRLGFSGVVSS